MHKTTLSKKLKMKHTWLSIGVLISLGFLSEGSAPARRCSEQRLEIIRVYMDCSWIEFHGWLKNPILTSICWAWMFLRRAIFIYEQKWIPGHRLIQIRTWTTSHLKNTEPNSGTLHYTNKNVRDVYAQLRINGPGAMLLYGNHAFAITTGVRSVLSAKTCSVWDC